ncbi:MAG: hypothetical protein V4638_02915 [Bacteroidota bacterium]
MKLNLIFIFLASFSIISCRKDRVSDFNSIPDCTDTISFATTILPLITDNCTTCHFSGNTTGYTLTNHSNISSNATKIINSMRGEAGVLQMPDDLPPLSDSLINLFECWSFQGKLNN